MRSLVYVIAQFSIIVLIAVFAPVWGGFLQNCMMLCGISLGLWAIATMRFHVNVSPEIRANHQLYTSGPYRYIRHPMYTAVLLTTLAWVFNQPNILTAGLWLCLLVVLRFKLTYEEKLLRKKYPEYATYSKQTARLLPNIW